MALRRDATDPAARLERLIRRLDTRFRQRFLAAVRSIREQLSLGGLADLLAMSQSEEALEPIGAGADYFSGSYGDAVIEAGRDTARFLNGVLTVNVSFDVSNARATRAIQVNRLRLIREFTRSQRDTVRAVIADGVARGLNPRDQARLFRDSIGLTQRQTAMVDNFRRLLTTARDDGVPSRQALNRALRDGRFDRTVMRAIRDQEALGSAQIERMVQRYRERMLRYRSEVIARTEALRSAHEGTEEMYRQAVDAGELQAGQLTRRWNTARDERVRSSHRWLHGVERRFGEVWLGDDGPLRFPGDPLAPASETVQCRCVLSMRLSNN